MSCTSNSWALNINMTVSTLLSLSTPKENIKWTLDYHPLLQVETPTFLGATLDPRLSWKSHIETVEKEHTRKTLSWINLQVQDGVLIETSYAKSILVPYAQSWNMHLLHGSPPPRPTHWTWSKHRAKNHSWGHENLSNHGNGEES